MSKPAPTAYPIHPVLQDRWSPRAFADKLVESEKLLSILEAARWAASSRNEQPWNFIVASKDNRREFEMLLSCLMPGNAKWAKNAPVLLLVVANSRSSHNDQPNRVALHDVGLAMGNFAAQTTALGLHMHMMGGFDRNKARDTYHIPERFEPVIAIALGYLGTPDSLADDGLREREAAPRVRKPLTEFVYSGDWGQVSPLVSDE